MAMLAALLAGWFAEPQQSFHQRWPAAMPPAISLQTFHAARKASARPSFCMPKKCRVG
jgi:hypothetical protein